MTRVGIVGVGRGATVHALAFRLVDGFEVRAICARTPLSLKRAVMTLGIADVSTDWRSFVRRDDLDVISIAAPTALHHPIAMAALVAGKHVLVEKPLALTSAECHELADAAASSGAAAVTCFTTRWSPERAKVRQLVRDGVIGDPYWVRLALSNGYWHPTRAEESVWMYDRDQSGGYLTGLVADDIDFVCSLFGPPAQVCADIRTSVPMRLLPDGSPVAITGDDTFALLMRLQNGALAVLTASVVGIHTSGAVFDAFGSNGSITGRLTSTGLQRGTINDDRLHPTKVEDRALRSRREIPAGTSAAPIRAMALMLEDWQPTLTGMAAPNPIPTMRDGLIAQAVLEAAQSSAAGAGWVNVKI